MPFNLTVGDMLAAKMWLQLDEQGACNTYNWEVISTTGASAFDIDFANAFDTLLGPFYRNLVPATVEYRGCQVYVIRTIPTVSLPGPVKSVGSAGVGLATGNPIPRGSAPIMKYNTIRRGPGGRGRVFLPFIADSFIASNGRPTNGFNTAIDATANVLLSPITIGSGGNNATLVWELVHKAKGQRPVSKGQMLAAESANKVGLMHKRSDYGRPNAAPI